MDEVYSLTCLADGYPKPVVNWYFAPCGVADSDCSEGISTDRLSKMNASTITVYDDNHKRLKFSSKTQGDPGILRCIASSGRFEHVMKDVRYFPTGLLFSYILQFEVP